MRYNSKFENFIDCVDFTSQDPCVWIVYPPGAAGDLLASIVNFHYGRTACYYFGITKAGQVIFRPTDSKLSNLKYLSDNTLNLNQNFINDVNSEIGKKNVNYSLLDQVIFSNHAYEDQQVNSILNFFPKAKIIRIVPKNTLEQQIINWLASQKNKATINKFETSATNNAIAQTEITDSRLLDISLGSIVNHQSFEKTYNNIINHLDLEYKLIRFDFVQHWLDCQHTEIKPILATL